MKNLSGNSNKLKIVLIITISFSLISFITSLTQPAFYIDRVEDPNAYSNSLVLFFMGWMSLLGGAGVPFLIWLANPLYIISIIMTIKGKSSALYYSLSATALALIFSLLKTIMTSESGNTSVITSRGLGFKLWFISFIVLSVGLLVTHFMKIHERQA